MHLCDSCHDACHGRKPAAKIEDVVESLEIQVKENKMTMRQRKRRKDEATSSFIALRNGDDFVQSFLSKWEKRYKDQPVSHKEARVLYEATVREFKVGRPENAPMQGYLRMLTLKGYLDVNQLSPNGKNVSHVLADAGRAFVAAPYGLQVLARDEQKRSLSLLDEAKRRRQEADEIENAVAVLQRYGL